MTNREEYLNSIRIEAEEKTRHYKSRARILSWTRLLIILSLVLISYLAMQPTASAQLLWAWLPGIPLFLFFVKMHESTKEQLAFYLSLSSISKEEISSLKGVLEREVVSIKVDPKHNYARELDLFGKHSLHHHLNRCWTKTGAEVLADQMMNPPYEEWKERQNLFKELEAEADWAMHYRAQGELVEDREGLIAILQKWKLQPFKAFPNLYWPLMIAGIVGVWISLWFFTKEPSSETFMPIFYSFVFNLALLGSRAKVLRTQLERVGRISGVIESFSQLLGKLEAKEFTSDYGKSFKAKFKLDLGVSKKLKQLSELLSSLDQSANVVVLIFLNGLFHYHLFRLRALEKWHKRNAGDLEFWLEGLYHMESYLSIANYHANHPELNWPHLNDEEHFEALELSHPLIPVSDRVANDLVFNTEKYVILTGSNMSGKSTFLRCIGVNLILAQMGAKVSARSFSAYPYRLLCSMNPQDDLRADTSYFQAEILRLRDLLNQLSTERTSFFLLDEILRGTNSNDKQEGTRGFLKKIEAAPAKGFIATHDVEIAHMADDNQNFRAAYFESKVVGEELLFDYTLREGICKTPNAGLLMRQHGLI